MSEGARRLSAVRRSATVASVVALSAALARGSVSGQTVVRPPAGAPDEGRHVGRTMPEVSLKAADGRTLRLSALGQDRPILLTLVFSRCVGVCSPLIGSLRSAQALLGAPPGDYRTVVVSFDPRDGPSEMAAWAERLRLAGRADWTFAVASPQDVPRLMAAVGFWSRWDEARQQFDHPALIVGVRDGRIVRMLVGGTVSGARLQEVVRELRGEFVAAYPLPGDVLVRCFQYDPARGRMVVDWGFLLLLLPAGFTLGATLALFGLARSRR